MNTAQAINSEIHIGDYVIVVPDDDYGCLVGMVKAINRIGTPEYKKENINVDFTVCSYPPWQAISYLEHFNELFGDGEYRNFSELPLDDVIIAPDVIISLTGISNEMINDFVNDYDLAERFCNQVLQDFNMNHKEHAGSKEVHRERLSDDPTEIYQSQVPASLPKNKKNSIGNRISAGNEKVKAYKEQKAQVTVDAVEHKKEDILQ